MKMNEDILIGLIGQGLLHESIKRYLKNIYRTIQVNLPDNPEHFTACTLAVYSSDHWSPGTLQEVNRCCIQSGAALLPVYTQFDKGVIGPWVIPAEKCCT